MNAGNDPSGALQDDQVDLIVEVFRMLADATRIQVLWALADHELSVNELAEKVGKPAPSVSQHLAKLRVARAGAPPPARNHDLLQPRQRARAPVGRRAVHNAEHAGPEVPAHHRNGPTLRGIAIEPLPRRARQR